jgi:aerobic-type carbon monoxide dehydrogenase small subunit (CoxS/CutS family)
VRLSRKLFEVRLLDVLRDEFGLRGTKYGCGRGLCGACTIHLDGVAVRSCQIPAGAALGRRVTTIEGLSGSGTDGRLHPVQEAWIVEAVPQCGYCQPGQIMTAAALLARNPDPSDAELRGELAGNLCRCGTYPRIRRAVRRAAVESRRG